MYVSKKAVREAFPSQIATWWKAGHVFGDGASRDNSADLHPPRCSTKATEILDAGYASPPCPIKEDVCHEYGGKHLAHHSF